MDSVKQKWESHWKTVGSLEDTATIWGKWLRRQRLRLVEKMLIGMSRQFSVLDMGCGGGDTLQLFKDIGFTNVVGIDFSVYSVKRCEKLGFQIYLMDAKNTNFPNQHFDIVFEEGLWEHFPNPEPYIREAARLSRHYIIAIQPNHYSFWGKVMNIGWNFCTSSLGGVKEYSFPMSYFCEKLRENGFELKKRLHTILQEQEVMIFVRRK